MEEVQKSIDSLAQKTTRLEVENKALRAALNTHNEALIGIGEEVQKSLDQRSNKQSALAYLQSQGSANNDSANPNMNDLMLVEKSLEQHTQSHLNGRPYNGDPNDFLTFKALAAQGELGVEQRCRLQNYLEQ